MEFPSSDSSDDEEYQPGQVRANMHTHTHSTYYTIYNIFQDEQTSFCSNTDYPLTDAESDVYGPPNMVSTPTATTDDQSMTREVIITQHNGERFI